MPGLAEAVHDAVGQPSSVRIGTIESVEPPVVSAQGVPFEEVGFIDGYTSVIGDTVALLGQSSGSGSDPASWLVLGKLRDTPTPVQYQAGEVLFTFVAQTSSFIDVTFAVPFPVPPIMSGVIAAASGTASGWFVRCAAVTAVNFRLLVNGPVNSWTNIPVHWTAHMPTQ